VAGPGRGWPRGSGPPPRRRRGLPRSSARARWAGSPHPPAPAVVGDRRSPVPPLGHPAAGGSRAGNGGRDVMPPSAADVVPCRRRADLRRRPVGPPSAGRAGRGRTGTPPPRSRLGWCNAASPQPRVRLGRLIDAVASVRRAHASTARLESTISLAVRPSSFPRRRRRALGYADILPARGRVGRTRRPGSGADPGGGEGEDRGRRRSPGVGPAARAHLRRPPGGLGLGVPARLIRRGGNGPGGGAPASRSPPSASRRRPPARRRR